jgi:membrane associated rhomboid family serine protease
VPTGIIALLGVLLAVQLVRSVLSQDADNWFVGATAFIPARFAGPGATELPGQPYADVTSWITHMLVHGSFVHLLFNSAWLLAFGGAVANRIGPLRCILFAALCGCAGALVFLFIHWGQVAPMVGASGAVLGLMGASMRFLFPALDRGRGSLQDIHATLRTTPVLPLSVALTDSRVILTTLMLIVLNAAGAFGMSPGTSGSPIAWEAHAGGYIAGLLLYGFFDAAPHNTAPRHPLPGPKYDAERKPTLH